VFAIPKPGVQLTILLLLNFIFSHFLVCTELKVERTGMEKQLLDDYRTLRVKQCFSEQPFEITSVPLHG